MIDIPVRAIDALRDGRRLKRYRFDVLNDDGSTDFTITNENLVSETVKFDERMCSGSDLKFGLCEGSSLEFQYFGLPNINKRRLNTSIEVQYKNASGSLVWHTIPMGFFDVAQCPMQFSTGIRKVVAYNKLKSEYLDAKANSIIIDAVARGEYGDANGVSIDAILNRTLDDYAIETDYEEVSLTYPTHSEIYDRYSANVSISGRNGNYSGNDPMVRALYTKNGDTYERYPDSSGTKKLWSVHFSAGIKITNYNSQDYYRIKVNCKRLLELFEEYSENYHQFYVTKERLPITDEKEPFLTFWEDDPESINPSNAVSASITYSDNGTPNALYAIPAYHREDENYRTEYILNPRVNSQYYNGEISIGFMIAWRLAGYWNQTEQRYYTAYEILYPHMDEYCAMIEEFLELVKEENLIVCERRKSSKMGNFSINIETAKKLPDVTLRELQSATFETVCQFGKLDRVTDLFAGVELNNSALYPRDTLYPANDLYPGGSMDKTVKSSYSRLWTDTVGEQSFRYLIITYKGLDQDNNETEMTLQMTVNSNGTTDYYMDNNWLFKNLVWTTAQVEEYAVAMVAKLQGVKWFPFEMWGAGLPYIETGDQIEIVTQEGSFTSYILQRQLNGIQNLQDTFINGELDIF